MTMAYHITAAKLIKLCSCSSCRAKYGQFATLDEAEVKLTELTGQPKLALQSERHTETEEEDLDFSQVSIPKTDLPEDLVVAVDEELKELDEAEADEHFKEESIEVESEEVKHNRLKTHALLDDEEFLKGDDEVLVAEQDSALLQQMENVVSWNLENFYGEDGKPRGKYSLRSNPPVFRIEASDGSAAEFVLSKNLALSLAEAFDTVKRGYYGVSPKKKGMLTQEEAVSKPQEWRDWMVQHPVKTVGLIALFILCVITAFTL